VQGVQRGREIVVRRDADEPLLVGRFDFVHSLRALGNVLENALKYSAGGAVEVETRRAGDELVFSVLDRGPGVPEQERERIFEPFYRPPGASPDIGGTGLGLTIARGLAEAQGGDVRYTPRPGGGSEFELRLPAAETPYPPRG
jgi:two-component system sensor histidine kinase KdpD